MMATKTIKKLLGKAFKGIVLPVLSPQLRGMRLKVDPLMPGNLFWNNVEREVHNVYDIFIKKGFVVLDIGANVGLHSYYISRHFKNITLYSFEPFPANAKYIKDMISVNKITNINLIEMAVGQNTGRSYFDTSINNHQGHIAEQGQLEVSVTSLDDFLQEQGLQPNFIKIDVEGAEAEVLNGFKKTIAPLYPTIIVEVHNEIQAKKVADFFRPFDYTLCKLLDNKRSKNSKPFLIIANDIESADPPRDLNGQIVAIPNKNVSQFRSYIA